MNFAEGTVLTRFTATVFIIDKFWVSSFWSYSNAFIFKLPASAKLATLARPEKYRPSGNPTYSAVQSKCSILLWASSFIYCLAALDFGAGVEQPFGCLDVQNRQAVQSMRRSMDWTLEDDMVNSLFFCATVTGRRGSHTHLQERKRPTPVRRRLSQTQALLGRVIPWGWVPVLGIKMRSFEGFSAHSAFHGWSAHCAARMLLSKKLMSCCARIQMGVSIWGAVHLHSMDGWALSSGAGVQAPWHGVLEIVWLDCDKGQ